MWSHDLFYGHMTCLDNMPDIYLPCTAIGQYMCVVQKVQLNVFGRFPHLNGLCLEVFVLVCLHCLIFGFKNMLALGFNFCVHVFASYSATQYKQIEAFIAEPFYKIKVMHQLDNSKVDFNWRRCVYVCVCVSNVCVCHYCSCSRQRLFNHTCCLVLYQMCLEVWS